MRDVINSGEDIHSWFGEKIKDQDPRTEAEKEDTDFRQMAKAANFGYPGGLGAATFQTYAQAGYGVQLDLDQCVDLRQLWLASFPEMKYHLSPVEDKEFPGMYVAKTIRGRLMHNATFCTACNYAFQGLTSDGAKVAMWLMYQAGYKMVNFIHDEIITELDNDQYLQQHIRHINQLMVEGMKYVLPDVLVKTEGALMRRWYKEAQPIYDDKNNLLVWEPGC
jgi:DNA polymerase-1